MQVPQELKIKYLQRRVEEIHQLICSLDQDDFAPAVRLGHQVKGNAVTFDFPQMAPIGRDIEVAAKNKDKQMIKNLVGKMSQEIELASQQYLH